MEGGLSTLWRRIGGTLALCAVVLYAALIPNHIVSQTIERLVEAEFGVALEITCHGNSGTQTNSPAKPKKSCPFCTGFAAFQLATLGAASDPVPPQAIVCDHLSLESELAASREAPSPNSRAPPDALA